MRNNNDQAEYSYWKWSWQKWVVLVAGLGQIVPLWININEYNDISRANILSASAWEQYASRTTMQCALYVALIIIFLGTFLIGALSRSRRSAKLAEGFLLLFFALVWGAAGFLPHLLSSGGNRVLWLVLLLLSLGGAVYSLVRYRRK